MSVGPIHDVHDLAAELRRLAALPLSTIEERKAWERAAYEVRCAFPSELADQLPEIVWHFLMDADLRWKDPEYAEVQLGALREALVRLEHDEDDD